LLVNPISIIALLSGLAAPGAGLMCFRRFKAGGIYLIFFSSVIFFFTIFRGIYSEKAIYIASILLILIYLSSVFHTIFIIFASSNNNSLKRPLLVFFGSVCYISALVSAAVFKSIIFGFEIYIIHSNSMFPTLKARDIVLADTWATASNNLSHGDIIFFKQNNEEKVLVKRLIAKEKEYVAFTASKFTVTDTAPESDKKNVVVKKIDKNHVFLIGDNINYSKDSRHFGSVPIEALQAKAIWVLRNGVLSMANY
jgi:signal peptidase I